MPDIKYGNKRKFSIQNSHTLLLSTYTGRQFVTVLYYNLCRLSWKIIFPIFKHLIYLSLKLVEDNLALSCEYHHINTSQWFPFWVKNLEKFLNTCIRSHITRAFTAAVLLKQLMIINNNLCKLLHIYKIESHTSVKTSIPLDPHLKCI